MNPIENEFQVVAEIQSATDLDKLKELALSLYFANCHMRQFLKDSIARYPGDFVPGTYEKIIGEQNHENNHNQGC